MGNNFGRIDAKKHRSEVFNVEKINNLSILYGTATFPPVFSQIMDVKSDTLPSLKHIAKTILRGCKGQKICYNSDIYHHNYNGEFMKKLFGFTLNACSANIATCIRNRKAAFTLAEVLITLGIIGVVAAMTMPTLIMQHQKKVFVTRVKQTYSIVSNALLSSVADNGAPNTWNFGDDVVVSGNEGVDQLNSPENVERIAKTYFAPYFKSIKEGRDDSGTYYINLSNGTTLTFYTDGNIENDVYSIGTIYVVASFDGNTTNYFDTSRDYSRKDVIMKVNISDGYAKLNFFNWGDNTRTGIINAKYGCRKEVEKYLRFGCGKLIQFDGWEIKEDYPWR